MSDSSPWFSYRTKFRFFARIRRFLQIKTASKCTRSLDRFDEPRIKEETKEEVEMEIETEEDLIHVLQRSVKQLHFGSWEEKEIAAKEIKRLARDDLKTRKSLAALGVILSLVSMVDSEVLDRRRLALQALIELANGTYTNKAMMVDAGILSTLPENVNAIDESTRNEFAVLLLSISSLANTQFPISSLEILPFLVGILDSNANIEAKEACLGSLYNLSTMLDNVGPLISNGVVHTLLRLSLVKEASEKALATLGNLVVTVTAKKAIENDPMVPECLIQIMTWEEKPKCQELTIYILMILAHQSSVQRKKMAQLGIVHVLLEVALLGSHLAQKRALKILQWFKEERQTRVAAHSGPQTGRDVFGLPINYTETQEGKKMMKKMVKQSLDKNMELIMKRANAAGDSSKLRALVISSSSKSLPY
ncbi:hypothetical protein HHK36_005090 [Tetracentron sinense]|uniref:U-box domain-containing protein 7 n=1 Tax=Tetracentron sinense TaxID=13715 RepID=A0A834ZK84_TETSI|nr:hypothetical protein HHK36_005090 [Tetracentron sinense]